MFVLSIAFALAPFAFGLTRYIQSGVDRRMLWMALASAVGALIVRAIVKARGHHSGYTRAALISTLGVATILAGATGVLLGAKSGPGVWMVAFVLGLCWMVSAVFAERSRVRHPQEG